MISSIRLSLIVFCHLSIFFKLSNPVEIECDVQKNFWTRFGSLNECLVRNVSSATPHEPISSITNKFLNLEEIKSFYIYQSPRCFYIPFGIEKYFPHIETLFITHSGLKTVTNEDLKPFRHLKGLYMHNNQIESLGKDFFIYNTEIEEVNLSDNKLRNLAFDVLEPLISLEKIEIFRNTCIDSGAATADDIQVLKNTLHEQCPPKIVVHKERSTADNVEALKARILELENKLETIQTDYKHELSKICDICDGFRDAIA